MRLWTARMKMRGGRKKLAKEGAAAAGRPSDHEALLAGNSDDHFRLGIKLTK